VLDPIVTSGTGRIAVGAEGMTQNVVLGADLETGSGQIAIGARGSIVSAGGTIVATVDGSGELRLDAGHAIGTATDPIRIDVAVVAAQIVEPTATGGVYLLQVDGHQGDLAIGSVLGVDGITTLNSGDVWVETLAGTLTVAQPVSAAGDGDIRIVTTGGGDIRIEASITDVGADNLVVLDADDEISQALGTLITAQSLRLTADNAIGSATASTSDPIFTWVEDLSAALDGATASGRIVVAEVDDLNVTTVDGQSGITATNGRDIGIGSFSGSITVLDPIVTSGTGRIAVGAEGTTQNVVLEADLQTGSGEIAIGARASIVSNGVTIVATVDGAGELRLDAGHAIGTAADPIQIDVAVVAAQIVEPAATGGVYLVQVDGYQGDLTIGSVLGVNGITTMNSGDVWVETLAGTLTVAQPVSADGSGDITLTAKGATSDVEVNAKVQTAGGNLVLDAGGDLHVADIPSLPSGESELTGASITGDAGGTITIDDGAVLESATGKMTNAPPVLRIGEKDPDKVIVPGDTVQELVGNAGGIPPGENLELGENFTLTVTWDDGVRNVVTGVDSSQELSMQVATDGTATVNVGGDGTNYIELDVNREYSIEYLRTVTGNDLFATIVLENDPNIRLSDSSGVDLNRVSAVVATSFSGQQFTAPAAMGSREPEPIATTEAPPAPLPEQRSVPPQPPSRSEEIRVKREEVVEDERKIYLVKVGPDGSEGERTSLPEGALSNLSALLERFKGSAEEGREGLPNGLYRIYLEEVGFPRRKVMEFYKSGDTLGEQVRPPGRGSMPILDQGSEIPGKEPDGGAAHVPQVDGGHDPAAAQPRQGTAPATSAEQTTAPVDHPDPAGDGDYADAYVPFHGWARRGGGAAVLAAGSLAAYPALGRWQQSIDRAMADSDEKSFGKAARLRRRFLR